MNEFELSTAEAGAVRWLRSLDQRTLSAIYLWLFTGNLDALTFEFTHRRQVAA